MIEQLRNGAAVLEPLAFRLLNDRPRAPNDHRFDALVEASWKDNIARFVVECKALSTPKAFRDVLNRLKSFSLPEGFRPMLFLPFLAEDQLRQLEREGISGIDLCGNGVVMAPGAFAVFRTGGENRFPSSAPIKNIYRKNSSMVARVFFPRSRYDTVQEIHAEINRRNVLANRWKKRSMSLSTVSKALKTLEEDLIIARNDTIRLVQPDKLLEKLEQNYEPPITKERIRLKIQEEGRTLHALLLKLSQGLNLPIVATGMSSVAQYAVMQRGEVLSVYCPRVEKLMDRLPGNRTERFPNLELIESEDERVYFDAREQEDFWWAAPAQVFLELMAGDKRDRETAEQVRSYILNNLRTVEQ